MLEKKLDFWLKNNLNVLLIGHKGCGKTSVILDCFKRNNLKSLYFSASTLDVWTDFVGIPKEVKSDTGSYLDFIRPKYFDDDIEAIFIDEFSRSGKKLRNSVMELLQFKSINGRKFSKLRVVWAAINPDDEDEKYDVEALDPAQYDRFQVKVTVPYLPNIVYFREKFGDDLADAAVTWWKELDQAGKKETSPRCLDYALEMYKLGGDVKDVLSSKVNTSKLIMELSSGSLTKKLQKLFEDKNIEEAKTFLKVENNYAACLSLIVKEKSYLEFFFPLLSEEKQISLISKYKTVETFVIGHFQDYQGMIDQIINANTQGQLVKRLKKACRKKIVQAGHGKVIDSKLEGINFKRYYVETVSDNQLKTLMRDLAYYNSTYQMTQDRLAQYKILNSRLYKNLDESSAKQILKVIHNLIDKSHASTIKNHYTNIIPMLNHVYAWYLENKLTPAQVPARAVYKIPQDTYLADLLPKATP